MLHRKYLINTFLWLGILSWINLTWQLSQSAEIVSGPIMILNTLVNFHSMLSLCSYPVFLPVCDQNPSRHRADNMKIYILLIVLGQTDCCAAGGGVNFDVTFTNIFICINICMILLFDQAGFHIANGNKDLSDMLNNKKESDNSAVYHSWINSVLEAILHELDEKFEVVESRYILSLRLFVFEVAEEDRESINFWMTCMGVFTLVLFIGMAASFTVMYTQMSKKQKGPGDLEMSDFGRDRRASRVPDDMNITLKREP